VNNDSRILNNELYKLKFNITEFFTTWTITWEVYRDTLKNIQCNTIADNDLLEWSYIKYYNRVTIAKSTNTLITQSRDMMIKNHK
jgi:hypothetical protein